jgi:hypothetical protein
VATNQSLASLTLTTLTIVVARLQQAAIDVARLQKAAIVVPLRRPAASARAAKIRLRLRRRHSSASALEANQQANRHDQLMSASARAADQCALHLEVALAFANRLVEMLLEKVVVVDSMDRIVEMMVVVVDSTDRIVEMMVVVADSTDRIVETMVVVADSMDRIVETTAAIAMGHDAIAMDQKVETVVAACHELPMGSKRCANASGGSATTAQQHLTMTMTTTAQQHLTMTTMSYHHRLWIDEDDP